jgi:hypothetical protein
VAVKGSEEVILVRPGGPDDWAGDPTGESTTLGIFEQCLVWPRISTEVVAEGTKIVEGYNVWIPWRPKENQAVMDEALELKATDRVVVRGKEWQVDGTPADHRNMRGRRLGVQMVTRRVA